MTMTILFRASVLSAALLLNTLTTFAQTVYAGDQVIDKVTYKGLFLTLPLGDRQVEKEWENYIKPYGKVSSSRGVYRITTADMRDISAEPVNLTTQVKGNKKSTTVFAAFDQGSGNFVAPGNGNYAPITFNGAILWSDYANAPAGAYTDTVIISVSP